ncbi:MAG: nicotinate-nucleotide adenylyltransferase [Legionella sp.]|nr:nicotinate-nucleotide adenylyltransferase [Legionella sp.]
MKSLAFFGGTFDPIHNGHLKASIAIQKYFQFDHYYFLPCNKQVLKGSATASNTQRITMLQLALKGVSSFEIDRREILSDNPSYTVKTLSSIRNENHKASITLIMGFDAFVSLPQWYEWEKLIELANILVMERPKFSHLEYSKAIQALLQEHQTHSKDELINSSAGHIFLFNAGHYDFSSTDIKHSIQKNKSVEDKLPTAVYRYINENKIYTD